MDPLMATVIMFAGNFAPRGWAFCDGQILSISAYTALFSLLGTAFGGDGRTTFGLPDLRGRVPINPGNGPALSPYSRGEKGGTETVTLNKQQIPSHNHSVTLHAESDTATSGNPNGRMFGTPPAAAPIYADLDTGNIDRQFATQTVQQLNVGGGQHHNNIQPYLSIYFIIALQGTYPSRN